MEWLAGIGRGAMGAGSYLARLSSLGWRTGVAAFAGTGGPVIRRQIMLQLVYTGVQALVPLTVAAIAIGLLVFSFSLEHLPVELVQSVASTVIVLEVIPLLLIFLIIGRSGTAITIDVASMKLNDELQALQVMGIDPVRYVALPRVMGVTLAFVVLQVYGQLAAIFGGYWGALVLDLELPAYPIEDLLAGIAYSDVLLSTCKMLLFGPVVALTAVLHGASVKRSRREIPIVTSQAVVRSLLFCFLLNTAVSLLGD